jgi:hypothetical protein
MFKNPKTAVLGAIVMFAFGAYAWSAIAVYVTLAGSVERMLIAGDAFEYAKKFVWYLIGPELPGASVGFWVGTIAIAIAFTGSVSPNGLRRLFPPFSLPQDHTKRPSRSRLD